MENIDKDALIERLQKENAELKARIEELERMLGLNSRNSSKPPSSDFQNLTTKIVFIFLDTPELCVKRVD